jgi:plastocyanin
MNRVYSRGVIVLGLFLILSISNTEQVFAPPPGGTPPGQGGTPPGQGGTPPGGGGPPGGTPPGQGGTPPGQGGTPPGQGGTPPGQGGTPPGQGGSGSYSGIPPEFLGIGFYKIISVNATNDASSEFDETTMESKQIKFGDYFPYSSFSDTTDLLNYGNNTFQKHGQFFLVEDYAPSIPTLIGETNQPIQIQVRLLQADDPTRIQHLNFYTNLNEKGGAFVIFDKNEPLQVVDPNGVFKSVKVNTSLEDPYFWVIIDLVFEKPMKKSDIRLEVWNDRRIVSYLQIIDALEIEPDPLSEEILGVDLIAEVDITHNGSSPICKQTNSCYSPYEAKVLEGGHVIWTNSDSFIHTVTSGIPEIGTDDKFNGILMPGESFQVKFEKSGVYRYYCLIHPWATGMVNVYKEGQSSLADEIPDRELIIQSKKFGGTILVEDNGFITSNQRTMIFDVSGHLEDESGRDRIDIIFTKPDGTKQKMATFANDRGHFNMPIILERWEGGSYGITAKSNGESIGSISFFLVDDRFHLD